MTRFDKEFLSLLGALAFIIVVTFVCLILLGKDAKSHSFYDQWCCNGQDCVPIPASAVKETPAGYVVTLLPGQHPSLLGEGKTMTWTVRYGDAKFSHDGGFHACILHYAPEDLRCFYAPTPGS